MFKLLAERPDLRDQLIAEPGRISLAVEELLRYLTPLPALARVTTEPVELGGVSIPAGERVQMVFIAGNHDPADCSRIIDEEGLESLSVRRLAAELNVCQRSCGSPRRRP